MYLYGSFVDRGGETVTVRVLSGGDAAEAVEIGADGGGVWFAGDEPVVITSEVNDVFDHVLQHSCVIRLLCDRSLAVLYSRGVHDTAVEVWRGGAVLFAGWLEPQSYEQPFNSELDEVELNCVDCLGALQYRRWAGVGSSGVDYQSAREGAGVMSMGEIIAECVEASFDGLGVSVPLVPEIVHDNSRKVVEDDGSESDALSAAGVMSLLFLGEDEEDAWTLLEVVEECLKWLGLVMVQEGAVFRLFSRARLNGGVSRWSWVSLGGLPAGQAGGETAAAVERRQVVSLSLDNVADDRARLSVGETFNQIVVNCDVEEVDDLVRDPLDDDYLDSDYNSVVKCVTEYSADGDGSSARDAFLKMVKDEAAEGFGAGRQVDWFARPMTCEGWWLRANAECAGSKPMDIPNWLAENRGGAILEVGSVETNTARTDTSPVGKISKERQFVVSVNGGWHVGMAGERETANTYLSHVPAARYTGAAAGGALSPSDEGVTNYVVISGKLVLNPRMDVSCTWAEAVSDRSAWWSPTVPSRDNKDGRLYTRKYWTLDSDGAPVPDTNRSVGWLPYTGKGPQELQYKYNADGSGTDKVSKVGVLACMLVVGDKCVVERVSEVGGDEGNVTNDGGVGCYEWVAFKERSECASDAEYYGQSFTIGIDPAIEDYIIGQEHEIQNNIDYTMGLDVEGMAIPVRKGDGVCGQVRFMVLGPVDLVWDEVTRRHKTWFRHTSYSAEGVRVMSKVSSVIVKDFKVKMYSDSGVLGGDGVDLVYMSECDTAYVNRKEIDMRLQSALTGAECVALGVSGGVSFSTVVNVGSGLGVLEVSDKARGVTGKAERLLVDEMWTLCHAAHVELEVTVEDGTARLWDRYSHPALDGGLWVMGVSRDLLAREATLRLRQ